MPLSLMGAPPGSFEERLARCHVGQNRGTALAGLAVPSRTTTHLKNLLIFSCNLLVVTMNRFGRYYDECASRGMRHNRALKAVAWNSLGGDLRGDARPGALRGADVRRGR